MRTSFTTCATLLFAAVLAADPASSAPPAGETNEKKASPRSTATARRRERHEMPRPADRRETPIATLRSLVNSYYLLDWDAAAANFSPRTRERLAAELAKQSLAEATYRQAILDKLTFAGTNLTDDFYQWQVSAEVEGRITVPISLMLTRDSGVEPVELTVEALRRGKEYLLDVAEPKRFIDLLTDHMVSRLRPQILPQAAEPN